MGTELTVEMLREGWERLHGDSGPSARPICFLCRKREVSNFWWPSFCNECAEEKRVELDFQEGKEVE